MCGRSFLISSDSYLVRTYEFTDETPQITEEKLIMTMDKAQETRLQKTKVSISVFSADITKSEEISRWRPIDKALLCDFSATKTFFENRHKFLSEGLTFFPAMGSTRSETKLSPRLRRNRHTDTQTDCYKPPPMLGLINDLITAHHCMVTVHT